MPKITLDVTAARKRLLDALAEDRDCTLEQLFEPAIRDLEENCAGIRRDLPDTLKAAITDDVVAKAGAKKLARENAVKPVATGSTLPVGGTP